MPDHWPGDRMSTAPPFGGAPRDLCGNPIPDRPARMCAAYLRSRSTGADPQLGQATCPGSTASGSGPNTPAEPRAPR
jgi:hypothetical protein